MDSRELWQLFLDTGAREAYLLYNKALRMENSHVSENAGLGSPNHGLQ